MIASLHGTLESWGSNSAVINVNGVGYQVFMSIRTLSNLSTIGMQIYLNTHLVLKEDSVILYGFFSIEELKLFKVLISVSGLGPRLALAMLSVLSVEQVILAIDKGDTDVLTTVPGIGKKMVERIVTSLKGKLSSVLKGQ
ncbi:MAG: Holliday junction branch migration protein RuvA [Candidatus Omnitrophica bacterium]|nr:Holliday junction branch migration protein RuvA [Candidatus Omnitrophota bacterium]